MVQISGAGLSSPVNLNLTGATVGAAVTNLQNQIATNTALTGAGVSVAFNTSTNKVTFTSATGEQLGVQVTGDTTGAMGDVLSIKIVNEETFQTKTDCLFPGISVARTTML